MKKQEYISIQIPKELEEEFYIFLELGLYNARTHEKNLTKKEFRCLKVVETLIKAYLRALG